MLGTNEAYVQESNKAMIGKRYRHCNCLPRSVNGSFIINLGFGAPIGDAACASQRLLLSIFGREALIVGVTDLAINEEGLKRQLLHRTKVERLFDGNRRLSQHLKTHVWE